ncbi:hypothetical protein C1645_816169 [Glomus cerebriforme]|uniref:Uncharacterized protein n=1 Tax=Glomus cerebriforme TaxID=658196 RepID=A0A397TCE5_9GLOM|nr:hypothetical protein C1645_816169 [Glomus cerebriforme]
MVVEKIKNGYDCHRVASSVNRDILSEESDLTDDMEKVAGWHGVEFNGTITEFEVDSPDKHLPIAQ